MNSEATASLASPVAIYLDASVRQPEDCSPVPLAPSQTLAIHTLPLFLLSFCPKSSGRT